MPAQTHFSGRIRYADEMTFRQLVFESDVPVLVEFYSTWSDPCRRMASTLEQVARENPDIRVVKVNVDEQPALAMRYDIESIPSVLVLKRGEIRANHAGPASRSRLERLLRR